jgi:hypothetical protein
MMIGKDDDDGVLLLSVVTDEETAWLDPAAGRLAR